MTEIRIEAVATEPNSILVLNWSDGTKSRIDLADIIEQYESLRPLLEIEAFTQVDIEDFGFSIEWKCGVALSVDRLWRLAREQSGEIMRPSAFREWRARCCLSLTKAAEELGLSRRMVAYYESGEREIPKIVGLACEALEKRLKDNSLSSKATVTYTDMIGALGLWKSGKTVSYDIPEFSPAKVHKTLIPHYLKSGQGQKPK